MNSRELVALSLVDDFEQTFSIAESMAKSGYFRDASDPHKAVVKILAGREMGLGPFASMTGIHLINGKPEIGANLLASMIKSHPDYDYQVAHLSNERCALVFFERGVEVGTSAFTITDAGKAGLLGNQTWSKYPRNMLFARAMSNGAKWYCPGIFGGAPVYHEGELGGEVSVLDELPIIESTAITPGDFEELAEELGAEVVADNPFDDENLINPPSDSEKDKRVAEAVVASELSESAPKDGKIMSAARLADYWVDKFGFKNSTHLRNTIQLIFGNKVIPNDASQRRKMDDALGRYRALRDSGLSADDALAQLEM